MDRILTKSLCIALLTAAAGGAGCGSDDEIARTDLDAAIGALAVTSPTASRTTTTSQLQKLFDRFVLSRAVAESSSSDVKPFGDMVNDLKNNLDNLGPEAMAARVGNMSVSKMVVGCYGPTWTDDATGSSVSRPSGDLGIVTANASSTDTTACAAAQLNALIAGTPQFANKLINLQATVISALEVAGKSLPAVGATEDALAHLPSVSNITFTSGSLSRLNDTAEGYAVYKTSVGFTDASSKAGTVTVYHTSMNADNSEFKGLIQAVLPHTASMGGTGTKRGLSMVYQQIGGVLTYALDTAANRTTDSSDFFGTNGRVDFTKAAFGEDGNRIIASFNSNTNAVTMHYAWQAGNGDGAVRAFAVSIPAGTEGSLTGFAYFGFGAAMSTLTDNVSSPWMTKMYCNWLAGLSGGSSVAEVQGQTFAQDSNKKFVASTSKINFAPTNTCASGSYNVTGANPSSLNGSRSGTKDLTTVGALGTVPAVTVPTYTIPSS